MSEIDLTQFCSTDEVRPSLHSPFSNGSWTYATNGHIIVRVQRVSEVAEREGAPDCASLFARHYHHSDMRDFPAIAWPKNEAEDPCPCPGCDGSGRAHDCPLCKCTCKRCNGRGRQDDDRHTSVGLFGGSFAGPYVRMLAALPNVKIPCITNAVNPMSFSFDGGEGLLMPLRSHLLNHVEGTP